MYWAECELAESELHLVCRKMVIQGIKSGVGRLVAKRRMDDLRNSFMPGAIVAVGKRISGGARWVYVLVAGLMPLVVGCQQWPGNQAMRQYQVESDRLLSEFRSQKKRAEDLEKRNYQLEQRLGESEREIARLQGSGTGSRMANRGGGSLAVGEVAGLEGTSRRIGGSGLPDVQPGPAGRLSSAPYELPGGLQGNPTRTGQWRPIPGR